MTSTRTKKGLDLAREIGANWELDVSLETNRKYTLRQRIFVVEGNGMTAIQRRSSFENGIRSTPREPSDEQSQSKTIQL
jgi:hypothetical protein